MIHPDPREFERLARTWPLVPVWTELLADVSTPVGIFDALAADGPGILLESVERSERWGRFSFVAGDPAAIVVADEDGVRIERDAGRLPLSAPDADAAALEALISLAEQLRAPRLPDLPSLTGGLAGVLSYEAAYLLDGHPYPTGDAPCPPISLQVIDRAVVFDHWRQRLLLVAHVGASGYAAGVEALRDLERRVRAATPPPPEPLDDGSGASSSPARDAAVAGSANMSDERYREIVRDFKGHIIAGDIFQGVPSRRVTYPAPGGGFPIYRLLRVSNPAPYMFFVRLPGMELAEHAMLVDLARNDIGRVCSAGSVAPTELMVVERFSRVMHIVSTVEGELADGRHPLQALAVTFPAGTVTGAPKRRAMELIARAEPTARGPYAGAVGYLTFAGDLDFCITIRTAVVTGGVAHVQSGGGIVAESDAETELRESRAKASALLPAVAPAMPARRRAGVSGGEPTP